MTERAAVTNSIGHVIAHENRHLAHYRNYARYKDKEIIREDISVRYEYIDGKIVATAGQATAVMKNELNEKSAEILIDSHKGSQIDIAVDESVETDQKKMKLDAIISKLEAALDKVSAKIGAAENVQGNMPVADQEKIADLKQKKIKLEDKKREIIKKRNMLDAEKLKDMVKDLLMGLNALVDQAASLMKAIYGLKSGQQIEQNSDKDNNEDVPIPDYSMLFTGILLDTTV
jgi:hypothetical protein